MAHKRLEDKRFKDCEGEIDDQRSQTCGNEACRLQYKTDRDKYRKRKQR